MNDAERKAAAMTPQQRATLIKATKKYITTCVVFGVVLLLIFGMITAYCTVRANELRSEAGDDLIINPYASSNYNSAEAHNKWQEKWDEAARLDNIVKYGCIVVIVVGLGGLIIMFVSFKKKHPYYSDKLYRAVKRIEKQQRY